jgi:hypothetical protein
MSGDVSTGIARFTTGHKLSVLRAQQSKVHLALEKLDSEVSSLQLPSRDKRSKEDWCKVLELQEQCLENVSKSYRQAAQKQLLKDIKAFRSIARFDPSLDVEQCAGTSQRLSDSLAKASTQSDLAVLFCDVLQQWLETDGAKAQETTGIPFNPPAEEQVEAEADGRLAIRAADFDRFLRDQGASEEMLNDVERIQERTKKFGEKTLKAKVQPTEVLAAIKTMASDPRWRTAEVREQLREESSKAMALSELASAFTSTLRHLDEWDWPEEGVRIEIQRHLNGKERQHLDLDVNLAIFLEVISTRWIEHFKLHLEQLRTSKGWSKSTIVDTAVRKFTKEDVLKYKLALQDMTTYDSELNRDGLKARFLNRQEEEILQVVSTGMGGGYEGGGYGDDVQDKRKTKAKAIRASKITDSEITTDVDAPGWHSAALSGKTARAYSHVFKMLCTDIRLLQTIDPDADITAVHLDIKDFGPSLDHSVPLAVFEYFGAPTSWLKWLQTFLQVRVRCEDGSVVTSRTGTPFGLGFSSLMNELLLVILDMAIAAKTKLHVHRNHDDFWFWSQDKDQVVGAHEVMTEFARMANLQWNGTRVVVAWWALREMNGSSRPVFHRLLSDGVICSYNQTAGGRSIRRFSRRVWYKRKMRCARPSRSSERSTSGTSIRRLSPETPRYPCERMALNIWSTFKMFSGRSKLGSLEAKTSWPGYETSSLERFLIERRLAIGTYRTPCISGPWIWAASSCTRRSQTLQRISSSWSLPTRKMTGCLRSSRLTRRPRRGTSGMQLSGTPGMSTTGSERSQRILQALKAPDGRRPWSSPTRSRAGRPRILALLSSAWKRSSPSRQPHSLHGISNTPTWTWTSLKQCRRALTGRSYSRSTNRP